MKNSNRKDCPKCFNEMFETKSSTGGMLRVLIAICLFILGIFVSIMCLYLWALPGVVIGISLMWLSMSYGIIKCKMWQCSECDYSYNVKVGLIHLLFKGLLRFLLLIIIILFSLNLMLTFFANAALNEFKGEVYGVDKQNHKLEIHAKFKVFPSINLGFDNVKYFYKNGLVFSFENLSADVLFTEFFNKKVVIDSINSDGLSIDLKKNKYI